jgi:hypothetical protein
MQIKNLHPFSYRARQVLSSNALSEKVIEQRRKVLGDWETLKPPIQHPSATPVHDKNTSYGVA